MPRSLEGLSELVLVEVLAALPLEQLVRVVRLGSPRLHRTGTKQWVLNRTSDVTFHAMVVAHQAGPIVREVFCSNKLLRRLYGRIEIDPEHLLETDYFETCLHLAKTVPGDLYLFVPRQRGPDHVGRVENFIHRVEVTQTLKYVIMPKVFAWMKTDYFSKFPNMVALYRQGWSKSHMFIFRPSLLNGRHVMDVLQAVCGRDVNWAHISTMKEIKLTCQHSSLARFWYTDEDVSEEDEEYE